MAEQWNSLFDSFSSVHEASLFHFIKSSFSWISASLSVIWKTGQRLPSSAAVPVVSPRSSGRLRAFGCWHMPPSRQVKQTVVHMPLQVLDMDKLQQSAWKLVVAVQFLRNNSLLFEQILYDTLICVNMQKNDWSLGFPLCSLLPILQSRVDSGVTVAECVALKDPTLRKELPKVLQALECGRRVSLVGAEIVFLQ